MSQSLAPTATTPVPHRRIGCGSVAMVHHGVPLGVVLRHDVRGGGHGHVHVVISVQGGIVLCRVFPFQAAWTGHVHRVWLLHVDDLTTSPTRLSLPLQTHRLATGTSCLNNFWNPAPGLGGLWHRHRHAFRHNHLIRPFTVVPTHGATLFLSCGLSVAGYFDAQQLRASRSLIN